MSKSFEVEVKVPISDSKVIKKKLLDYGAKILNSEIQTDTYFDHPCRSFLETDEALRVRSRSSLDKKELHSSHAPNELTYKGPKIDKTTKTRLEYSVGIDDTDSLSSILESLGFKAVGTITKRRTFYILREITISIDDVEQVGQFLELESIVHHKEEMESIKSTIFEILDELDIDPKSSIRKSYLELYLKQ